MKKTMIWLLVITMLAFCLTACGPRTEPPETTLSTMAPSRETEAPSTAPTETKAPESPIGHEDTYWVAESCWSGEEGNQPIDGAFWAIDLLIRVDGTACFRDIHEGVCLMDDSALNLTWERSPEGAYLFYSVLYPQPLLRGTWDNGVLSVEYWETVLTMNQAAIPQTVGQRFSPAELEGTWLMVTGETEGWQFEAMPAELSSIVFRVTSLDGPLVLSADIEDRDYYGNSRDSRYWQVVEILDQPLYEGCENEAWSVRIGPASTPDANGFPTDTEFYATLLDRNTLQVQRYYTLDGYPAVSQQTYWRLPELVSWTDYEGMELELSNWVCTGYENHLGEELPLPAELEGIRVLLDENQRCHIRFADGRDLKGTWMLENGGVLLLRGEETQEEPFWYGGVVSAWWVDTADGPVQIYQMVLYRGGGLIKLSLNSYG